MGTHIALKVGTWWVGLVFVLALALVALLVGNVIFGAERPDSLLYLFPLGIGAFIALVPGVILILTGAVLGSRRKSAASRASGRSHRAP